MVVAGAMERQGAVVGDRARRLGVSLWGTPQSIQIDASALAASANLPAA